MRGAHAPAQPVGVRTDQRLQRCQPSQRLRLMALVRRAASPDHRQHGRPIALGAARAREKMRLPSAYKAR